MSGTEQHTAVDTREFRRTMGLFATGVGVLAVPAGDDEIIAMTANAITSVSLDPTLILVCVGKQANISQALLEAPGFTVSFLSETQEALSNYFAGYWNDEIPPPAFEFAPWEGGPRLAGTIGTLGCRRYEVHEGGDHWIVLGEVTHVVRADDAARPLLFFRGEYHTLAEDD